MQIVRTNNFRTKNVTAKIVSTEKCSNGPKFGDLIRLYQLYEGVRSTGTILLNEKSSN
jgi:hypothetical protein